MSEDQDLSNQLRSARQQSGQSIEDVQRQTGLSANVLLGLESGRFEVVEPVYTRLALRAYAAHLGLDVAALLAQYDRGVGATLRPVSRPPLPLSPTSLPRPPLRVALRRWIGLATAAIVVLLLLFAFFGGESQEDESSLLPPSPPVSGLPAAPSRPLLARSQDWDTSSYRPAAGEEPPLKATEKEGEDSEEGVLTTAAESVASRSGPTAVPPSPPAAIAVEEEDRTISPAFAVAPARTAPPLPEISTEPPRERVSSPDASESPASLASPAAAGGGGPLRLEVEAVDTTWVEVRDDRQVLFQGLIPAGERRRWETRAAFLVHSGRAHGLRYWLQGRLLGDGRLGDPTQVLRFRATRDSLILLDANLQPLGQPGPGADERP